MSAPDSILITGGAGFVGSNLALSLKRTFPQARITAMDNLYRKGSELNLARLQEAGVLFHRGDIRRREEFPAGPFGLLIECSAEPSVLAGYGESPDYLMETNFSGAYQCLEMARQWGSSVMFLSTSRVYPIEPLEKHPWVETEDRFLWADTGEAAGISSRGVKEELLQQVSGARSLYGFTKYAGELLIEEYRAAFGLRAIVNRCGVIAGPWQFGKVDQGVVALWVMRHHFKNELAYIGYGGAGKQVRDVLHVADLCELVALQVADLAAWDGWVGNVAGGLEGSASLRELTALCREVTGNVIPIRQEPETRRADLRIFMGDCARLFARTTWRPKRDLRCLVGDVHEWIRQSENDLRGLQS
jgi:CDP-paratose 2-epimerase